MNDRQEIMVSIVCNTYNHVEYISDAIEGFLKQKTFFLYEILIMDDASTDGTDQIIKEYERKYPGIIKPIFNNENMYSKGLSPGERNRERAKGKYIALCEGDDYWIDENKLQDQIEYMESHPQCTFCFTNGKTLTNNCVIDHIIPWTKDCRRKHGQVDFDAGEIELLDYIPTASFFFPNGLVLPPITELAFKGDAYIKLSLTNMGYAHFIDKPYVVYRRTNYESLTHQWDRNVKLYTDICEKFIQLFLAMKEITNHQYDEVFDYRILQWEIQKHKSMDDSAALKEIVSSGKLSGLKYSNLSTRVKLHIICRCPKLVKIIKRYKLLWWIRKK